MAMYGTSQPCPPWAIGARVWPGLTWEDSNLMGQDVVRAPDGSVVRVLGITRAPDHVTLDMWSDYVINACDEGFSAEGGWSPARSLWVEWGSQLFRPAEGPSFFYKAGDEGMFDLNYAPAQDPINVAEGVRIMEWSFHLWCAMVWHKMLQRTLGVVPLQSDIPKAEFEDKVREHVRRAQGQLQSALSAAATHVRNSHRDAAEPETIKTFFPSNMILGPSSYPYPGNMILDVTESVAEGDTDFDPFSGAEGDTDLDPFSLLDSGAEGDTDLEESE